MARGKGTAFNSLAYTIELLLPIVDFGQRKAYLPNNGWQQIITYTLVAFGWVLVTTIAAGLTRALRRQ